MVAAVHRASHEFRAFEDWIAWLTASTDEADTCLRQYPDELMIAHMVSRRVNNTKNNDDELLKPLEQPATT